MIYLVGYEIFINLGVLVFINDLGSEFVLSFFIINHKITSSKYLFMIESIKVKRIKY